MKTGSLFSFAWTLIGLGYGLGWAPQAFGFEAREILSGKQMQFSDASPRARVIAFLSAKCPCSAGHEPALKILFQEFSKDFDFVGVHSNQNEDMGMAKAHFKKSELPFPVVRDAGARIASRLGATKTPHVFVMREGRILYQGGIDDTSSGEDPEKRYLRDALLSIREGKSPEIANARVLGCAIRKTRN